MSTRISKYGFWMLLIGTFSLTQIHVIGNIGISELIVFMLAPIWFARDLDALKKHGFMPIITLSILTCIGCVVASLVNDTPITNLARGFASPYAIFSTLVVGHRLVSRDPRSLKWLPLGLALSVTINIFVFQRGVESTMYAGGETGLVASEGVMSSPIFWTGRIRTWLEAPIRGWYLQMPMAFTVLMPLLFAVFAMLTTTSGRSAAVVAIGTAFLALLGGKTRFQMARLSRSFWIVAVIGMILIQGMTMVYKYTALSGALGEDALKKYEGQIVSKGGKGGVLATLMGGRLEFFVGAYACLQKPIIGFGPWAVDEDGYYENFLNQYGSNEDFEKYLESRRNEQRFGMYVRHLLPSHSHIIGFWQAYGIFGLIFWVYVLIQVLRYFRYDLATVPQWFGFLALAIPAFLWDVFFSPFGDRVAYSMLIVALMMTRAIRQGRVRLPLSMIAEMNAADRK